MVFQQNGIDFGAIDISLDDEPEDAPLEGEAGVIHAKELEGQIEVLKEEVVKAKKDLSYAIQERDLCREDLNGVYYQIAQLKDELKRETIAHELTKKALQERDNIINQLKRVSTLVYDEFTEVQGLYEMESAMREKAEILASQYYTKTQEAEAFKRQSTLLLNDALSGDDKLLESLTEVEKVTKQLEEERQKHKLELKKVRDELDMSEDRERMMTLENKLSIAKEENESLEKRVQELETKNKELDYELEEAKKKPSLPNIPPPPPPPPPPALPKNPLEMLQKMLGRKRAQQPNQPERKLDVHQQKFEEAMADMVNRIKKGQVHLRPTKTNERSLLTREKENAAPSSVSSSPVVKELDSILLNLKNKKRGPRVPPRNGAPGETEVDSQFQQLMEKRRQRSDQPTSSSTN